MAWVLLAFAGLLEIVWAIGLKQSKGFTVLVPSLVTVVAMLLSFGLLAQALRTLPVGTAYAVWTGIGTVGATILGMVFFGEPRDISRVLCIGLIIFGILGLKFISSS